MLRRITRLITGLLATGLLLALAPSASAAATYDITQVGDADWGSVTSNGRELSGQTTASDGLQVTATVRLRIDDIGALREGDTVLVKATAASGSHFGPNLFSRTTLPPSLLDRQGNAVFTVSNADGDNTILKLTRTGTTALGSYSCDLAATNKLWRWMPESKTSTWRIGKSSTYTFASRPQANTPCASNNTGAWDPNGGDGDAFKKVGDSGTTATTAEAGVFLRKGHTFAGWNTKADGTGTAYQAGAGIAYPAEGQTLTLYAQWEANAYKTEFRDWRGRTITSGTARYGTTPTVPALSDTTWLADPDMNFDNVDGWRDDWWHGSPTFTKDGLTVNSRDTRANGRTVGANAAIHVEADADYSEANATNAAKSSGIGFNINNGSNSYQGWDTCPNGRQCEVDAVLTAGLASPQTIEPWVQIANDRFNGYGTATVHRMQLTQVDPTTHNGLARDGYVFTGWNKDPSKPVEGDTVYTAQYRPAVYKVRFDANGGTGAMAEQSHTYDRKQALTASAFTREGYRFTGWNTRGDGKGKAFTDEQTVSNLLAHDGAVGTLYAQWQRIPETALPWSGGTMTHNLTTILGGFLSSPSHSSSCAGAGWAEPCKAGDVTC